MRFYRLIISSVLCFVLLVPAVASAGGLFLPAHGVRGLGRGGAFTAGGDDPAAMIASTIPHVGTNVIGGGRLWRLTRAGKATAR